MNIEERKKYYECCKEELLEAQRKTAPFIVKSTNDLIDEAKKLEKYGIEIKTEKIDIDMVMKDFEKTIDSLYLDEEYHHDHIVLGVDISPVLDEIKNKDVETPTIIAIKDGVIVETKYLTSYAPGECSFKVEECETFRKKHLDCKLFALHNHPIMISAKPSDPSDYRAMEKLRKNCNIIGFGVVTKFDFYKQMY